MELKKEGDAVLSNAHILAPQDSARKRDVVYQPGREGQALSDDHRIGVLQNWIHLRKKGANHVDAAVALLDEEIEHNGNVVPKWCDASCAGKKLPA